MSNTFATELMPRILAGALQVLREEMVIASKVTKDYNGAAAQLGQTVSIAVPQAMDSYSITPAATPPALVDAKFLAKTITIDTWKGSRFHLTSADVLNYNAANSMFVPNQIAEAARRLARDVNQAIYAKYTKIYGYTGNALASLFASNINATAEVDYLLNFQLCPPSPRIMAVTLLGRQAALQLDDVKKNPQLAGDTEAFRRASLGMIYGMDVLHDRDVPTHDGSASNITGTPNIAANVAKYGTTVTVTANATQSANLVAGDVVRFTGGSGANVYYSVQDTLTLAANGTETIELDRPVETALTIADKMYLVSAANSAPQYIAGDP
ncbi:MAG: P22 phage major capsid protein family protein, partial [Bryobacteraceae bacterium]